MVELKRALPDYFTAVYEVDAVLNAVSKELDRLYAVIDTAFANLSVTTASGAFERWENDLGLSHYGTDEERRQAILANLGLIKTQTTATIVSLIRAFARHAEAVVSAFPMLGVEESRVYVCNDIYPAGAVREREDHLQAVSGIARWLGE